MRECFRRLIRQDGSDEFGFGGSSGRYLQVEVSDLFGVKVQDSVQDLLEELRGLLLAQRLLLCQEVKELAAGDAGGRQTGRRDSEMNAIKHPQLKNKRHHGYRKI